MKYVNAPQYDFAFEAPFNLAGEELHRARNCTECELAFDDNPGKSICKRCEAWIAKHDKSQGELF